MARKRQAPGGGTVVEVEPERLGRWFDRFADRNDGVVQTELSPRQVRVTGGNGVGATVPVPFEPLGVEPDTRYDGLAAEMLGEHMVTPRLIGLVTGCLGAHDVWVVVS